MASTHDIQELDVSSILATQILTWIDDEEPEAKGYEGNLWLCISSLSHQRSSKYYWIMGHVCCSNVFYFDYQLDDNFPVCNVNNVSFLFFL